MLNFLRKKFSLEKTLGEKEIPRIKEGDFNSGKLSQDESIAAFQKETGEALTVGETEVLLKVENKKEEESPDEVNKEANMERWSFSCFDVIEDLRISEEQKVNLAFATENFLKFLSKEEFSFEQTNVFEQTFAQSLIDLNDLKDEKDSIEAVEKVINCLNDVKERAALVEAARFGNKQILQAVVSGFARAAVTAAIVGVVSVGPNFIGHNKMNGVAYASEAGFKSPEDFMRKAGVVIGEKNLKIGDIELSFVQQLKEVSKKVENGNLVVRMKFNDGVEVSYAISVGGEIVNKNVPDNFEKYLKLEGKDGSEETKRVGEDIKEADALNRIFSSLRGEHEKELEVDLPSEVIPGGASLKIQIEGEKTEFNVNGNKYVFINTDELKEGEAGFSLESVVIDFGLKFSGRALLKGGNGIVKLKTSFEPTIEYTKKLIAAMKQGIKRIELDEVNGKKVFLEKK